MNFRSTGGRVLGAHGGGFQEHRGEAIASNGAKKKTVVVVWHCRLRPCDREQHRRAPVSG